MTYQEFSEQREKELLITDKEGHYHTCPKCKDYHYCPGIKLGFHCADREESKCINCCGKHINAIKEWKDNRIVCCHDCGEPIDFTTWDNVPSDFEKERWFYNPNVTVGCQKCLEIGIAKGYIHTIDEFFDNYDVGIDNDGELTPINIVDGLNKTVN